MIFIVIGIFVAVAAWWDVLAATILFYKFANHEAKESYNPIIMLEKYTMEIL